MLEGAPTRFPFKPPRTKECYHYRQIFEKHFKGHAKWTPYKWVKKWCETNEPSARALKHYKTITFDGVEDQNEKDS